MCAMRVGSECMFTPWPRPLQARRCGLSRPRGDPHGAAPRGTRRGARGHLPGGACPRTRAPARAPAAVRDDYSRPAAQLFFYSSGGNTQKNRIIKRLLCEAAFVLHSVAAPSCKRALISAHPHPGLLRRHPRQRLLRSDHAHRVAAVAAAATCDERLPGARTVRG